MEENNIVIEQTTGDIAGGKSINIGTGGDSMGDVQAGIEFIYHMHQTFHLSCEPSSWGQEYSLS